MQNRAELFVEELDKLVVVVLLTNRTREVEADAELVGITEDLGWRSNSASNE